MWNNDGTSLMLDQKKIIEMASASRNYAFNVVAQGVRKRPNSLFDGLKDG